MTDDDAMCPMCGGQGRIIDASEPDGVRVCPLCGGSGRIRMA
ncbi:DnaJ-class molecular chaperone [Streptomonospora nanhaiensis]|uniref:DnaJ-class molecular chaperone n=1 Tax=Streptomonospora nanhaiensis TaxID=1323731 RepID=A0A853BXR6_9ACTN|nr:DnaJ-class molecular chaperone [Streptomonospora nanhaiensis]